jgi:hypothetical protein
MEMCSVEPGQHQVHGGIIEICHKVICLFHPDIALHFDLPGATVKQPLGMHEVLTPDATPTRNGPTLAMLHEGPQLRLVGDDGRQAL